MQRHYIIGTAGHIDHGKTTLAKALTGKDTDRLKEEKERSISIELGFAPFSLPNGDNVSLIDVPGHEKFIRHMVAGVGGIDLVLMVIAADEGVMPQTKEHLQIIELLGIENGIIVLTKKDLVEPDFIELVEEDIRELLKETSLKNAPIISVSSTTNEGIAELKELIQHKLLGVPERSHTGFFRMPIDRVFTLKGIGTIITGTVYSGSIELGQELVIMPAKHPVRVRSLQVHSQTVNQAFAGQRVAINIVGVDLDQLNRGDSLVAKGQWEPSQRVDIELKTVKDLDFAIKQNTEVKLLIGTAEVLGKIIFYDRKEAKGDELIYGQLKLAEPIISSRKERFIIRRPSPSLTIGGGKIIDPNAKRHKYRQETIESLIQKANDSLTDILTQYLLDNEIAFITLKDLSNTFTIPEKELTIELKKLLEQEAIVEFSDPNSAIFASNVRFRQLIEKINRYLKDYHHNYPMRTGMPKSEFVKLFLTGLKTKSIQTVLEAFAADKKIKATDENISIAGFEPEIPARLLEQVEKLEQKLIKQQLAPEQWEDLAEELGITESDRLELYNYLQNNRRILKLTDKTVLHSQSFEELKLLVTEYLSREGQITLQQAKDLLGVSRKYLVPLMELLDNERVTALRQGHDYRVLRKN